MQCRCAPLGEETSWVCRAKKQNSMYSDGQLHFSPCMRHIKQSRHVLLSMLHVKGKTGKEVDQQRQRTLRAHRQ